MIVDGSVGGETGHICRTFDANGGPGEWGGGGFFSDFSWDYIYASGSGE